MAIKITKTFCMAPWVHMNIGPNGDVYPCCMMPICGTEGVDDNKETSDNADETTNNSTENNDTINPLEIVAIPTSSNHSG